MRARVLVVAIACVAAWSLVPAAAQRGVRAGDASQTGAGGGQTPPGGQGRGARGFFRGRGEVPTGTASIRGQVTSETGAPVRRAQVRAIMAGVPLPRLASTDADGRFELRDLPAGQWALTASKPGFVTQRLGQRRPYETVSPIELADGQRFGAANFALVRGGAITGRVFDDFGDPLANVRVQVLRSQFTNGQRRLTPVAGADESDDTGAFRLYGLAPGEYYVSAVVRGNPADASADATGFAPTYYPGTGSVGDAQRITLGAGEEQSVSFALQPVRMVRVSGVVVSSTGAVVGGGVVTLTGAEADEMPVAAAAGARVGASGAFMIPNVAPGTYVLSARIGAGAFGGRAGGPGSTEPEVASVPLTVGGEDLSGLTVTTSKGATIEGRVTAEGTGTLSLSSLQVTARAVRTTPGSGPGRSTRVGADGTFRLTSIVGSVSFRVEGLPATWTVKAIVVNDADVSDGTADLRGSEQITGARVVVTDRVTEVHGTVSERGQPVGDSTVVVFPDEPARWTFPTRYIRTVRTASSGAFTLRGLPPYGSYRAVALAYVEDGEWQDPAFLERLRSAATSLTLREGETKTLDLPILRR